MSNFKLKNFRKPKLRTIKELEKQYGDLCALIGDKEFQIRSIQKSLIPMYSQCETMMKEVQANKLKESQELNKPQVQA